MRFLLEAFDMNTALTRILTVAVAAALLTACSAFKAKEEDTRSAAEMYAEARENLDKRNWRTAVEQLRELEAKYPYGAHAEQAQLDTIYAHYRNNDTGQAVAAADRFIKLHPTHDAVDYAYYIKGLAHYQEDDSLFGRLTGRDDLSDRDANLTRNALDAFNDVHTLFPNSRYAADSRARAQRLHNALARHELTVAAYYHSREARVAVVGRAKGIVENFSTTPVVEDALALLVFTYRDMNLPALSDAARRVLELNFPASAYLAPDGRDALTERLRRPGDAGDGEEVKMLEPILGRFGG